MREFRFQKAEAEPRRFFRFTYSHNNSGGRDWLTKGNWGELQLMGWRVIRGSRGRELGAEIQIEATSVQDALIEGVRKWKSVVKTSSPFATGCECCGPPHHLCAETREEDVDRWGYVFANQWDL